MERGKLFISILHGSDFSRSLPNLLFFAQMEPSLSASKADQSLLFSPDVKNQWSRISILPYNLATFITDSFSFLVVCFLQGNSQTSEFYMPTFRNTLSVLSSQAGSCVQNELNWGNVWGIIREKVFFSCQSAFSESKKYVQHLL